MHRPDAAAASTTMLGKGFSWPPSRIDPVMWQPQGLYGRVVRGVLLSDLICTLAAVNCSR